MNIQETIIKRPCLDTPLIFSNYLVLNLSSDNYGYFPNHKVTKKISIQHSFMTLRGILVLVYTKPVNSQHQSVTEFISDTLGNKSCAKSSGMLGAKYQY